MIDREEKEKKSQTLQCDQLTNDLQSQEEFLQDQDTEET
jgi:hypothetical protein